MTRLITCAQCHRRTLPAYDDHMTVYCGPCWAALKEELARPLPPDAAEQTRAWLDRIRRDDERIQQAVNEGRLPVSDYGGPKVKGR